MLSVMNRIFGRNSASFSRSFSSARRNVLVNLGFVKDQGIFQVELVLPTVEDRGNYSIVKSGCFKLSFVPRKMDDKLYDYKDKVQMFIDRMQMAKFLSGSNIRLERRMESGDGNPGNLAGEVKTFVATPNNGGYDIAASKSGSGPETSVSVSLEPHEIAVLNSHINYALPYLTGFDLKVDEVRAPPYSPSNGSSQHSGNNSWPNSGSDDITF